MHMIVLNNVFLCVINYDKYLVMTLFDCFIKAITWIFFLKIHDIPRMFIGPVFGSSSLNGLDITIVAMMFLWQ